MYEGDSRRPEASGPVTPISFGVAVAVHLAAFLVFWTVSKIFFKPPDVIIPVDMTIVPPWAEKTDDPEPDPNPPPPKEAARPKPKLHEPEPEKPEKVKQDAVQQEKPKPQKPKPKKLKPIDKSKAKLVNTPRPEPVDLRKKARLIPATKKFGQATASEKPLSAAEIQKLLDSGYRYGSKNQLATSESQRCVSVIAAAIRREWDKETFTWYPGLKPLQVTLRLRAGGVIAGFRIEQGSGDADVDRTARAALARLTRIAGLSAEFIAQCPELTIEMKPVQH